MKRLLSSYRPLAMAFSMLAFAAVAHAQADTGPWKPSKAIRLVVPFPAGGAADVAARIVAEKMAGPLGQPVVVENRSGANGLIGSQLVFAAPADGLTLLAGTIDTQAINQTIYTNLTFEPNSFVAVAPVALTPIVMATAKNGRMGSVKELVEFAKKGDVNYGHWGIGGLGHLATEVFKQQAGIPNMRPVPFQGSAPGSQALMAGTVEMMMLPLSIGIANTDRLNLLGVASAKRFEGAKNVPTLAEVGYPIDADGWLGIFAPPKTPRRVVEALNKAISQVMNDPEVNKRLIDLGMSPQRALSPEAYASWVTGEQVRWAKVIHDTGIKLVQ